MKKKDLIATWLANMSVGATICGGFQTESVTVRVIALWVALFSIVAAIFLAKLRISMTAYMLAIAVLVAGVAYYGIRYTS